MTQRGAAGGKGGFRGRNLFHSPPHHPRLLVRRSRWNISVCGRQRVCIFGHVGKERAAVGAAVRCREL